MPTELPPHPNLQHLKKQAKALLRDFHQGKPDATEKFTALRLKVPPKLSDAQHLVAREGDVVGVDVVALLVTVNAEADRVAMHAVRRTLVEAQAERLGLPLRVVDLPHPCPNDVYEALMATEMGEATAAGVDHVIFGDLCLADVRAYREQALSLWALNED